MSSRTATGAPQGLARRAFIATLVTAVPAAAVASTTAAAAADDQVARMVDLRSRWRALNAKTAHFEDRLAETNARWMAATKKPVELVIQRSDEALLRVVWSAHWLPGQFYDDKAVARMRGRRLKQNRDRWIKLGVPEADREFAAGEDPVGTKLVHGVDYDWHVDRAPWPKAQARLDEIVQAFDRWDERREVLRSSMGLTEAEDAVDEHYERVDAALFDLVTMSVTTIEALRFKAGLLSKWSQTADADVFDDWRTVTLFRSLMRDLGVAEISGASTS